MTDGTRMSGERGVEDCLPEWTYSVYIDRELEPDQTQTVEAHLVRCRGCRELVMTLEDEATALRAALRVEETAPAQLRAPHAPAPAGLAMGVGSAVALALVCLSALGWLIQIQIPSAMEWLNPFELTGVFSMFFDTVAMLRDEAPALYELALSVAALFSVAFLLTASFSRAARRFLARETAVLLIVGCTATLSLLAPTPAASVELLFHSESETVPAGEVVEQTWVTSARTVTIAGTLRGDLIVFGDRVVVSGVIDGNLVSAARKLDITGRVTGSIVAAGERVRISGAVERNVYAGAEQTTLTESGSVGRDLVGVGEGVLISGAIGRDAMTYGSWIEVHGKIGRDLAARAEHAEVSGEAHVGGDVHVTYGEHEDAANVEIDPAAIIAGETTVERDVTKVGDAAGRFTSGHFYAFFAVSFAAAFVAGMALFRLAPWVFGSEIRTGTDFFRTLAYGFVTLVATPAGVVLVALTIVGIPVALIGLLAFGVCAYFSKIVIGGIIGIRIFGEPVAYDWRGFGLPLVAGLGIVYVAAALPYVGGIVGFLALLAGLGAIVDRVWLRFRA